MLQAPVGQLRRCGRSRRSLGYLRERGRRLGAGAVGADHVFGADRPLRTEVYASVGGRTCPIGLAEYIERLGKPPAFVLVLENIRRVLAARNAESGGAGERNTQVNAVARQNNCPRSIFCLSLKTYFASSRWRAASLGRPKGYRQSRPLAARSLA